LHDATNHLDVGLATVPRTVEVNDVDPRRAERCPADGHFDRVVAEDGLTLVVALLEADALAASNVDRRYHFHGTSPLRQP
jgi:hypothetical protein